VLKPARVLREMRAVGLLATELGPDGFLPSEPTAMANTLSQHGLRAIGGFTPLVLHTPTPRPATRGRPHSGRLCVWRIDSAT
jgi:inosose dehydratase